MSRKVSSSAPSSSYRRASSTGSPASTRSTKLTPLTTRPSDTSRHGMTRTATDMPTAYELSALPWTAMSPSPNPDAEPPSLVGRLSRDPTLDPPSGSPDGAADEFCRLACLVYSEVDSPERWAKARELLAADPEVVGASIAAAACAADPEALA